MDPLFHADTHSRHTGLHTERCKQPTENLYYSLFIGHYEKKVSLSFIMHVNAMLGLQAVKQAVLLH